MREKISSLLVRFKYINVALILLLTAFFASQLIPPEKIKFDFSFKKLLLKDDSDIESLIEYKSEFGEDIGTIAILLKIEKGGATGISNTVFLPENLKIISEFTDFLLGRPEIDKDKIFSITVATNLRSDPIKSRYLKGILTEVSEIEKRLGLDVSNEIKKLEANIKKESELAPEILEIYRKLIAAKEEMLAHRLYRSTILSADATAASIVGIFNRRHIELASREPLIYEIVAMVGAKNKSLPPGKSLYLTGVPPIESEYKRLSINDLLLFTPVSCLIIGIVMLFIFKSLVMTLLTLLVVFSAVVTTIGFMQWTGEAINILNTVIPVIILVLGVSDSIHILSRYGEELQNFDSKNAAVKRTFTAMILACLLTSTTNAVGFGSLFTASIPSICNFGLYTFAGCLIVYVYTIIGLSSLFSIFPAPASLKYMSIRKSFSRLFERLGELAIKRSSAVCAISGILIVANIPGIFMVKTESKLLEEIREDNPYYIATKKFEKEIGGVMSYVLLLDGHEYIEKRCLRDSDCFDPECNNEKCTFKDCCRTAVCLLQGKGTGDGENASSAEKEAKEEEIEFVEDESLPEEPKEENGVDGYCSESVRNLELLHFLDRLKKKILESDPERKFVTNVSAFSDLIKELYAGFIHGGPSKDSGLPEVGREEISQLLLPLESASPETIRRFVNHNGNATQVLIDTKDEGSTEWFKLEGNVKNFLEELRIEFPGIAAKFDTSFSGTLVFSEYAISHIIRDLVSSILFAFVIIAILMILIFRSLKIGIISMIPNVIPLFMTFGFMGYTGISLRTATAVIFAISLGIAVNDTIHLLARFSSEVREGKDLRSAIRDSVSSTGMAMMFSTLVLIVGFSINLFSEFVAVYQFGILVSTAIFWALLADIFLAPALIYIFRLDREIRRRQE